jgi:hypothetical protein
MLPEGSDGYTMDTVHLKHFICQFYDPDFRSVLQRQTPKLTDKMATFKDLDATEFKNALTSANYQYLEIKHEQQWGMEKNELPLSTIFTFRTGNNLEFPSTA